MSYTVDVLKRPTKAGTGAWWWACPGCGGRCSYLYLPSGEEQVACRVCLGLVYTSQYTKERLGRLWWGWGAVLRLYPCYP